MKRHSLALLASERWEYPEGAYSSLDFVSRLGLVKPFWGLAKADNLRIYWESRRECGLALIISHPPQKGEWRNGRNYTYTSSLGVARPFTNKVEKGWKNVQTLWWVELD